MVSPGRIPAAVSFLVMLVFGLCAGPAHAEFLWAGGNEPFLYLDPSDDIEETLDAMAASDLRVLRIMIAYHFEPEVIGVYDYSILDRVDFLIQEARERGIVLMIVFDTTYFMWPGSESVYLNHWTATEFFTEPLARMVYKNRIEAILNHVHPSYGKPWKEIDDVIWAWELMNEPWIRDEFPEPDIPDSMKYEYMRSWHNEMAGFVKQQDPNTLVSLGIAGYSRYYGNECGDDIQMLGDIPDADIYTLHFYGGALGTWIDDARVLTDPAGKLLFVEEFGQERQVGMSQMITFYTNVTSTCQTYECPWMFWRIGRGKADGNWQIWTDDQVWWTPVDTMAHVIWDTATDQPWTVDAHVTACERYWDRCEDVALHDWSRHEIGGDAISVEASGDVAVEGSSSLKLNFDPSYASSTYAKFSADGRSPYDWSLVDTLRLSLYNGSPSFVDVTLSCVSGAEKAEDALEPSSLTLYPETWYESLKFPLNVVSNKDSISEFVVSLTNYSYPGAVYLDGLKLSTDLPGQPVGGKDSLVIESFESYDDTNDLQQAWYEKPSGGAVIDTWELATSSPAAGAKYMEVTFDLNVSPWWGGVEYSFGSPVDVSGFDGIDVAVRGTEGVYLTFQIADNAGLYANYDYLICHPGWTYYHCPLDSFVGESVNTAMLNRVAFFTTWEGATSGTFCVDDISAGGGGFLAVEESGDFSPAVALGQNFPNPFNPTTSVPFSLERTQEISLMIYDIRGRRVRRLHSGRLDAGDHVRVWDGRDDHGVPVSCGVYLCVLDTPRETSSEKMVLVR